MERTVLLVDLTGVDDDDNEYDPADAPVTQMTIPAPPIIDLAADEDDEELVAEQECTVCYELMEKRHFPRLLHAGKDDHTVCINCWEQHLYAEL